MTPTEWLVVAGGVGAIALVNWWFFFAQRSVAAAAPGAGLQQQTIVVQGGYAPSRVRVRAGEPIRLVFDRQERAGCSEEVVFPDFGVRRFLPPFERTTIELRPMNKGHYEFTCGMGMLHGSVDVE